MDVEERQSKSGPGMGLGSLMTGRDAASGDVSGLIDVLMNKYGQSCPVTRQQKAAPELDAAFSLHSPHNQQNASLAAET